MGPCLRAVQAVHLALQASSGMVLGQTVNLVAVYCHYMDEHVVQKREEQHQDLMVLKEESQELNEMEEKDQCAGSSSQAGAGKHDLVPHIGCDYEEIKDAQKQLPTNPSDSSNTVYATAHLPTNPSDSSNTVYATAQLPTNPSDSSNTVYATAQLPTNPSDSSNTVYATTQLPTIPSVSPNCVYSMVHEATGDS
ncbi:CMRF35-like molecule 8 [Labeo rohita]|uniref:CMRF35-like molecule 8 n=1 Tax=Labeo rohita TaxID=84645 RepID=A0A498L9E4_LABRO|nr:CMRF35-like molecule 8 [Labeo rohita]